MKIQKFLHSCLLAEENSQRLLIDPGGWSSSASEIGAVDVIVITHEHQDHFDIPKIKELLALKKAPIITNSSIVKLLAAEGIESIALEGGQTTTIGAFTIDAIEASHGDLPVPKPINVGYIINKTLFTPGDSFDFKLSSIPSVLALPVAAPWGTTTRAVELALELKPQHIIPVHDAVLNPEFAPRILEMIGGIFEKAGLKFHPLKSGEILEI
jgi:L-ascorbate metabolism protein UlaG (beta-lactamase superfamily)